MTAPRAHQRHQATFAAMAATLSHNVRSEYPPPETARRDAHPKHHGCVEATFTVNDDVPNELRHGVFQPGASYRAVIRYSNAFKLRHDFERDARGMAIKLMLSEPAAPAAAVWDPVRLPDLDGRPAELMPQDALTQDFLLVTHSEFFSRNAAEFLELVNAIIAGGTQMSGVHAQVLKRFFSVRPPRFRWRHAVALFRSFIVLMNPLFVSYFSQVPFRNGPAHADDHSYAVKFCARPKQRGTLFARLAFVGKKVAFFVSLGKIKPHPEFLRRALHQSLAANDAVFEFCIQQRTDPDTMPMDDATRPWSTRRSPYRPVATIRIHADPRYADEAFVRERLAIGERLTYSPWHALEAHRPLGSINRARLFVYAMVSKTRNGLNGTDARVPAPDPVVVEDAAPV